MNLEWRQLGPGRWDLVELPTWKGTRAQVFSYRLGGPHDRRIIETHIVRGYYREFKEFDSVKEAKAWAVAMCQLS